MNLPALAATNQWILPLYAGTRCRHNGHVTMIGIEDRWVLISYGMIYEWCTHNVLFCLDPKSKHHFLCMIGSRYLLSTPFVNLPDLLVDGCILFVLMSKLFVVKQVMFVVVFVCRCFACIWTASLPELPFTLFIIFYYTHWIIINPVEESVTETV